VNIQLCEDLYQEFQIFQYIEHEIFFFNTSESSLCLLTAALTFDLKFGCSNLKHITSLQHFTSSSNTAPNFSKSSIY